jgi:hypothetical protein
MKRETGMRLFKEVLSQMRTLLKKEIGPRGHYLTMDIICKRCYWLLGMPALDATVRYLTLNKIL